MATFKQSQLLDSILTICVKTQPGKTIPPQDVLASEYGASRTSVREALAVLEFLKVITVRQKTGTVVNPAHAWHVLPEQFVIAKIEAARLHPQSKPEATLEAVDAAA